MQILRRLAVVHAFLMIPLGAFFLLSNPEVASFKFFAQIIFLLAGFAQLFYATNTKELAKAAIVEDGSLDNIFLYSNDTNSQIVANKPWLVAFAFFASSVEIAAAFVASRQLYAFSDETSSYDILLFLTSALSSGLCAAVFNLRTWNLAQIKKK